MTTIYPIRFSRSAAGTVIRQITVTGLLISLLCSCATTKKVAEADDPGQSETTETGMLAKGGAAASGSYVDPMVTTAHGRKLAQNGMPASGIRAGTPAKNALTQTYSPMPASIAGAVTEPTGVRAGNTSIFSGQGPAQVAETTTALTALDTAYPAANTMPTGGVNAMTRSVFSTGTPVACGNDANGNMISC